LAGLVLYENLRLFAGLARGRGDGAFDEVCTRQASLLSGNIEANAWDGGWYRRAYFDDGTPLGSSENDECQIDSLSQSWAVISGGGDAIRARQAMAAVDKRLVRRDTRLIQLFAPPFDKSDLEPGYIKGYVPGVRENGGQYTHGAIWTAVQGWQIKMISYHQNSPSFMAENFVVSLALVPAGNRGNGGCCNERSVMNSVRPIDRQLRISITTGL